MTPRGERRPPRAWVLRLGWAAAAGTILAAAERAAAAGVLSAPADGWESFRGTAQLTGSTQSPLPDDPGTLWTYAAGAPFESTAAIAGGVVYAGAMDGVLHAVDLATGAPRWKYAAGQPIKSSPTVIAGTVYFGDEAGVFHAVDARQGTRRWTFQAEAAIVSSATAAAGLIVFGSNDNNLYALSRRDGAPAWKLATAGYVYGTPALMDGPGEPRIVSAGCDGFLRVVRARDGAELRRVELGGYVGASPAVAAGRAYVGTFENQFLAVDLSGQGRVLWRYEHPERKFPFHASAAVNGEVAIVAGRDKLVRALRLQTGEVLWEHAARSKVDASPVLAGSRVVAASAAGDLVLLDAATGRTVWRFEAGTGFAASPAVAAGTIVIGDVSGTLYAFGGRR
ncbi:MAG TPA: PQQ-binding-like beta-propeller repeat protein [Candidatus Polarisedimenticolia bacterium]|nr:PQQ-binding-like beta-propeller repeat protein [Candidatus Polarisedimenticolia bacterium]